MLIKDLEFNREDRARAVLESSQNFELCLHVDHTEDVSEIRGIFSQRWGKEVKNNK